PVLTNGSRGHELGHTVVDWALAELLGARKAEPQFRALNRKAAEVYSGRYTMQQGQYVVTIENGGLLLTFEPDKELLKANPELANQLPPPLPLGFVGKDKLLVQGDFNAGASVEFLRNDEGNVAWMRFGGRIQTRAAD